MENASLYWSTSLDSSICVKGNGVIAINVRET